MHSSSNTDADASARSLFMATLQIDFIAGAVARASRFRFSKPRRRPAGIHTQSTLQHEALLGRTSNPILEARACEAATVGGTRSHQRVAQEFGVTRNTT